MHSDFRSCVPDIKLVDDVRKLVGHALPYQPFYHYHHYNNNCRYDVDCKENEKQYIDLQLVDRIYHAYHNNFEYYLMVRMKTECSGHIFIELNAILPIGMPLRDASEDSYKPAANSPAALAFTVNRFGIMAYGVMYYTRVPSMVIQLLRRRKLPPRQMNTVHEFLVDDGYYSNNPTTLKCMSLERVSRPPVFRPTHFQTILPKMLCKDIEEFRKHEVMGLSHYIYTRNLIFRVLSNHDCPIPLSFFVPTFRL